MLAALPPAARPLGGQGGVGKRDPWGYGGIAAWEIGRAGGFEPPDRTIGVCIFSEFLTLFRCVVGPAAACAVRRERARTPPPSAISSHMCAAHAPPGARRAAR